MKKLYCLFLFCSLFLIQLISSAQSLEIAAGQNFIPGDYLSLRYESSPDYVLNWGVKAFAERAHTRSLQYSAYGLDFLAVFPVRVFRFCVGPTIHYESEPWVYAGWDFSKRLNLGVCTEAGLQFDVSANISVTGMAQQKFLLNAALGNTRFTCAIGLKYSFGN